MLILITLQVNKTNLCIYFLHIYCTSQEEKQSPTEKIKCPHLKKIGSHENKQILTKNMCPYTQIMTT